MPPKKEAPVEKILLGRPSNNLKMGIVGLPNVGKSTFFNVLTSSNVRAENFPFCTIEPEEARVAVTDERHDWLCQEFKPSSKIPSYLTIIDIAGLVKGASSGQGLGNAFLSHIKAVDGIFHMIRAFTDDGVVHVEGDVDPIRDLEIIKEELRLKDIEYVEKALVAAKKDLRSSESDKAKQFVVETLVKVLSCLKDDKKDVRHGDWTSKEIDEVINSMQLLTAKSAVFLVNVSERDYIRKKNKYLGKIKAWIDVNSPGDPLIPLSGEFESALLNLEDDKKEDYIKGLIKAEDGIDSSQVVSILPKIVTAGYKSLNLGYFFTAGPKEVRAWTLRIGSKAPKGAGVIHTDFERGFIMAEVMHFNDLKECGSEAAVRASGKYYSKGRDYVIEDGDVIFFKFNVTTSGKK